MKEENLYLTLALGLFAVYVVILVLTNIWLTFGCLVIIVGLVLGDRTYSPTNEERQKQWTKKIISKILSI